MADRFNPRGAPVAGPNPYEGWDLVARNPFLPVGEYQNANGDVSAGFAMPSMVSEPANALYRLLDTPAGTMPNPQNEQNRQDALMGLMSFYGGNALTGMAKGAGTSRAMQALSDTGKPNPLGAGIAQGADTGGITAYHGSPHDFDKFDMSKIGTGEGAQAFGHGLYFAENEGVAHTYRTGLGPQDADGALADKLLREANGDKQQAMRSVIKAVPMTDLDQSTRVLKMLSYIDHGPTGHMYQVRINANPEDFLDWDKPLSHQSEKVRNALSPFEQQYRDEFIARQLGLSQRQIQDDAAMGLKVNRSQNLDGILQDFDARAAPDIALGSSQALREAGIPGIKYLDQMSRMSRDAGEGSRNYVVFDDSLIEILKKYGLIPATYGASQMLQGEDYTTY